MTNFVTTVRPVYEKLVQLRDDLSKADVNDPEELLEFKARIEAAEHNVFVAWARSVCDTNPTVLDAVIHRLTWYSAIDEYLNRMLYTEGE